MSVSTANFKVKYLHFLTSKNTLILISTKDFCGAGVGMFYERWRTKVQARDIFVCFV